MAGERLDARPVITRPDLHFGAGMTSAAEETARQARWMEELGYEYFSAGEHYMRGSPPSPTHASLPLLEVAAGATESVSCPPLC